MNLSHEQVLKNMAAIGLVKPDYNPISFAEFKRQADIHKYGRGRGSFYIFYFGHPKENMFGFEAAFGNTKVAQLKECYENYLDLLETKDSGAYAGCIQWGNCGIPISCSRLNLRVRDTSNDEKFILD